jgi:hypothetical protein
MKSGLRARLKRLEDIDPSEICCDGMRESLLAAQNIEIAVIPGEFFIQDRVCNQCGKVRKNVRGLRMAERVKGCNFVAASFVDIDEGVTA